jgi:hypothetical protein
MTLLTPGFLATASLEVHRTAEQHWHDHGTTPIKIVLFASDGVPQLVDFAQGIGQDAAGDAARAHAARIGAVAVVLTAMTHATELEIDLPPNEPGTGQQLGGQARMARLSGDFGRAVVTLTVWPAHGLAKALRSNIITSPDGPAVMLSSRSGPTGNPGQFTGLITWLTGLLPGPAPEETP